MATAAPSLDDVLRLPAVWKGDGQAALKNPVIPSGHRALDSILPGGGWPTAVLTEILVDRPGIGELQLLMPAAAKLTRENRWLAFINAPCLPYAPALAAQGIDLRHVLMLNPTSADEQAWACEQLLQATCCGAVLFWANKLTDRALRRLQHAAERGSALAFLYHSSEQRTFLTAALRLKLSAHPEGLAVSVLKQRGGRLPPPVILPLSRAFPQRRRPPQAAAEPSILHRQFARQ